jgi:alpha-L-rhamnosidase
VRNVIAVRKWVGAVTLNHPLGTLHRGSNRAVGGNRPYRWVLLLALVVSASASLHVTAPKCEHAVAPLGVDVAQPRLSWQLASVENGQRQTAWQILVASSSEALAADHGDLWDSGKVNGDQTTFISYAGRGLASSQQVFWKIRSWDRDGKATGWSQPATWTMGLLEPGDWRARWLTSAEHEENLLLRREFTVKPGLRRALAHVTGLGQYELFLNGEKAGTDVLSPGWTDYKDTVLYDTRDVTALLRTGANAAGLSLGNGMLHVVRPAGRFAKFLGSFGNQRAILHLRLEYADGSVETVTTDERWKIHAGPITFSSIYGGEDFDARLVQAGWNKPGFAETGWMPAVMFTGESGALRGQSHSSEPVAPIETRPVVATRELAPGVVLYDFGQNTSFMPRLRVSGPAGSVVKLTAGEVVKEDGTIERSTMGGAHRGSAWWQYTKATDGEETWFPQFYYLGSRYLYVELLPVGAQLAAPSEGGPGSAPTKDMLPKVESVEMVVVHSTAKPVGHFATSDPVLNRIRDLVRWAQRSNMVSILTDCPHREKLGWLEQNHLNGPSLRYEWDLARLGAKNVRDMAEAQTANGLIPNIAPEYTVFKGTFRAAAEWGASFIMVPWQQHLFTGDDALLREQYDAMKRYFGYLEGKAAGGLLEEGLGDWYDQVLGKPGRAYLTPPAVTATAHYYQNAAVLAKIAGVLDHPDDAKLFAAKAEAIRAVFNRELFKPGTPELYGSGSQTSVALPLALGIAEPAQRDAVLAALLKDIAARGHSSAGAIGTRYLLRALTDAGQFDLIYRLITNPDMPGYAYQLKQGNTSLAESWTGQLGASQNHFFLGQVIEWCYQDLAGIASDETAPGFKHIIIKPHPAGDLAWVEAGYESVHGPIAVRWDRKDGKFVLKVTIPANTTATVYVPAKGKEPVVHEIESGAHTFESAW